MTTYLLNFTLCSALLLLAYVALLKNKPLYTFNRFYLLFAVVFSLTVPLIVIHQQAIAVFKTDSPQVITPNVPVFIPSDATPGEIANTFNYLPYVLLSAYLLITGVLLFRYIKNLYIVRNVIDKNNIEQYKGIKIVLINSKQTPHTFLNFIFLNQTEYQQIDEAILLHEMAHAKQLHSIDVILIELVQAVCWFNPFIFLYRRYIKLNHEFLADAAVLNTHYNIANYQNLLIQSLSRLKSLDITSQFNYAITKKRLIMMYRTTNTTTAWLSRLAIVPVAAAAFMLFTTKTEAQQQPAAASTPKEKEKQPKQETARQKAAAKKTPPVFGLPNLNYQYTTNGVSPELLAEYKAIVDKYDAYFSTALGSHGKNMASPDGKIVKVSDTDKARLKEIYGQMSKDQQAQQLAGFMMGDGGVLPRTSPTAKQFNAFKNIHIYGLWINGKKVGNAELDNYQPADFAQVFISKLYGGAAKGRIYKYQVDLMTTDYYDTYRKETLAQTKIARLYFRTPPGARQTGLILL